MSLQPYVHPNGEMSILAPPPGYDVDLENPQRQYVLATYWTTGILCFIGLLFLGQRFFVRLYLLKKFQIEDGK